MSVPSATKRLTIRDIGRMRQRAEPIAMLTAYDSVTASLVDKSGIDIILVGDSLGNVVLGYDTTLKVSLDDMIRHSAAVARSTEHALLVCDMPFGTTTDPETALRSAVEVLQQTGVQAVKIEGGLPMAPVVRRLTEYGIPVVAHIGLMPQSVHQLGGYYTHGKAAESAERLTHEARVLEAAGAFAIVLECVVPEVANAITAELTIPTIGIGSGAGCAGQVLVINDLIGLNTRPAPSFARPRADAAGLVRAAVADYVAETKGSALQTKAGAA
ncbi:3-methyl-2-oxobutanoate hydroxymethyltransferase [Devosia sp.]|uniref:3-methyl-2-oxobutanoate hydroxymethyltransferase n=1 Tax=Devosia sp. TaxID=1871048 RepID=UPI001AC5D93A|nr:3-methyl-2-oxobutanoate hydroxymethyltransferase [Devosia sp.]MBN9332579.1 3-methyl-2-oxobutanoate hydroxymethyltransferase [Devosia sp.]